MREIQHTDLTHKALKISDLSLIPNLIKLNTMYELIETFEIEVIECPQEISESFKELTINIQL
tara:strand:+ start:219 stop:407 length:189 start_codon:yes stop_codon:yes gene_type:complete